MLWSLLFNIILIVLVIHLCLSAFKYVRVSLFHHFLIPVYSLIMLAITMKWTSKEDLITLAVLALIAICLGLLGTTGLTFRKKYSKKHKLIYEMRRGWPYVIS